LEALGFDSSFWFLVSSFPRSGQVSAFLRSFGVGFRVFEDGGEDQVQLVGFPPEVAGFETLVRHGGGDHAKKVLRFAGFLPAGADTVLEVLFGHRVVSFAVVGPTLVAAPTS
jgi:hypothetical protein